MTTAIPIIWLKYKILINKQLSLAPCNANVYNPRRILTNKGIRVMSASNEQKGFFDNARRIAGKFVNLWMHSTVALSSVDERYKGAVQGNMTLGGSTKYDGLGGPVKFDGGVASYQPPFALLSTSSTVVNTGLKPETSFTQDGTLSKLASSPVKYHEVDTATQSNMQALYEAYNATATTKTPTAEKAMQSFSNAMVPLTAMCLARNPVGLITAAILMSDGFIKVVTAPPIGTPQPTPGSTPIPDTFSPTDSPTGGPTISPTSKPTLSPTQSPFMVPLTGNPTQSPTKAPTLEVEVFTATPTKSPTPGSKVPTTSPTTVIKVTVAPTISPTRRPTTKAPTLYVTVPNNPTENATFSPNPPRNATLSPTTPEGWPTTTDIALMVAGGTLLIGGSVLAYRNRGAISDMVSSAAGTAWGAIKNTFGFGPAENQVANRRSSGFSQEMV